MLDGLRAADSAAIGPLLVSRPDALDHDDVLESVEGFWMRDHLLLQIHLRDDPLILAVKKFLGLVLFCTRGNDDHPVADLFPLAVRPNARSEISNEPIAFFEGH